MYIKISEVEALNGALKILREQLTKEVDEDKQRDLSEMYKSIDGLFLKGWAQLEKQKSTKGKEIDILRYDREAKKALKAIQSQII